MTDLYHEIKLEMRALRRMLRCSGKIFQEHVEKEDELHKQILAEQRRQSARVWLLLLSSFAGALGAVGGVYIMVFKFIERHEAILHGVRGGL